MRDRGFRKTASRAASSWRSRFRRIILGCLIPAFHLHTPRVLFLLSWAASTVSGGVSGVAAFILSRLLLGGHSMLPLRLGSAVHPLALIQSQCFHCAFAFSVLWMMTHLAASPPSNGGKLDPLKFENSLGKVDTDSVKFFRRIEKNVNAVRYFDFIVMFLRFCRLSTRSLEATCSFRRNVFGRRRMKMSMIWDQELNLIIHFVSPRRPKNHTILSSLTKTTIMRKLWHTYPTMMRWANPESQTLCCMKMVSRSKKLFTSADMHRFVPLL